jgi:hypothetical protein
MQSNKKQFKKILLSLVLIVSFFFTPLKQARAWIPDALPAELVGHTLDIFQKNLDGILLAAAKQAAASTINMLVNRLVSGGKGGPKIITNWKNFIVKDSAQATHRYMNDYLTQATRGRGSRSGYTTAGGEGFGKNYSQSLAEGMKRAVINEYQPTVDSYIEPGRMLARGNFQGLNTYLSGVNSPYSLSADLEEKQATEQAANEAAAAAEGVAGKGFLSTKTADGTVVTPASTTADIFSNTQDLGNKLLAGAQTLPEVAITSMMNMLTRTITKGIGDAAEKASAQINSTIDKTINQGRCTTDIYSSSADAAMYARGANSPATMSGPAQINTPCISMVR